MEEVFVDIDKEYASKCVEKLSARKGELIEYKELDDTKTRIIFMAPSRSLMGFMVELKMESRGTAVVNRVFAHYQKGVGKIDIMPKGKLVSMDSGTATAYALNLVEERGILFISPGEILDFQDGPHMLLCQHLLL